VVVIETRDNSFYNSAVDGFQHGLKIRGYDTRERLNFVVIALTGSETKDTKTVRGQLHDPSNLILTLGTDATRIVAGEKPHTSVLFGMILDPVRLGLVQSIENPRGVFTGSTILVSPGKQIEALIEADPQVKRVGVLFTDGDKTSIDMLDRARQDAAKLGAEIVAIPVTEEKNSSTNALDQLAGKVDAIWVIPDPASTGPQAFTGALQFSKDHKVPILGSSSGMVHAGALLALSANLFDLGDMMAEMAVPIIDGSSKPADVRVRGPRKTQLSVNLDAARDLGIKIPDSMLHLADEVVDSKAKDR